MAQPVSAAEVFDADKTSAVQHSASPILSTHVVQFYRSDEFLVQAVASFLGDGLAIRQPALLIATEPHRAAIARLLEEQQVDVELRRADGLFQMFDVDEMLQRLIVDGVIQGARFRVAMSDLLDDLVERSEGAGIRVFGEMADRLNRRGASESALRLEGLWSALLREYPASLLCAYALDGFKSADDAAMFAGACGEHGSVMPAEPFAALMGEPARSIEISRLQQRAIALEAELEQRRRLEESMLAAVAEAEAARAEAERANRLKEEFLATLSHELRAPLNTVLGWTHVLGQMRIEQVKVRQGLKVIARNASRQLRQVHDLLELSRMASGTIHLRPALLPIARVVAAAIDSVRPAAIAKRIGLSLSVDGPPAWVNGETDRLQQALWNLLSNAVKFTPDCGRVAVHVWRDDTRAHVVVEDSGPGIPPDVLPHVFERLRRPHPETPHRGGLGVGLAVVKYLVEAHGGTVSAESPNAKGGATFEIVLPLADPPALVEPEPARGVAGALDGVEVLVLDADDDSRDLFVYMLSHAGANVAAAATPGVGLALAADRQFDVLVHDVGMSGQQACEFLAGLRAQYAAAGHTVHAVAVSAFSDDDLRDEVLEGGYRKYVTKPIDAALFAHAIAGILAE